MSLSDPSLFVGRTMMTLVAFVAIMVAMAKWKGFWR